MLEDLEAADEISNQAGRLLRAADAYGRFPTPVDDLVRASQLREAGDYVLDESLISKAPAYLRSLLRSARHKIHGIIDRRARVIHISPAIDHEGKRRFVSCFRVMRRGCRRSRRSRGFVRVGSDPAVWREIVR